MRKKLSRWLATMFAIALSVTMTATPIAQAAMVESSQEEAETAVETSVDENSLLEDSLIFESSEEEQEVEMVSENSTEIHSSEVEEADETNSSELGDAEIVEEEPIQVETTEEESISIIEEQENSSIDIKETVDETDIIQATTEEKIAEGACGENLNWYLTDDGKLYVDGTGEMESYAPYEWVEWYGGVLAPWYEYRENIKEVYLSDQITELGSYAFQNCNNLNKVNIPKSVTEVGGGVFAGCSGLKEISFPNNVKKITSMAFARCSGLIKVTIPNSVTEIGVAAFGACSNLSEITIPNSVVKIDDEAFFECSSLKKIVILNQNCEILTETSISGNAIIYGYANSTAESYAKKYKRTFKALDSQTSTYTISYDANGGKNAPAAQTKKKDKTLTLSKTKPTRKGYTFLGWATSKSSTKVSYKPGASFTQNKNTTLYAVWKANTYKVVFYNNNGKGSMSSVNYTYGKSYTLKANTFKRTGYTFKGWNTKADGTARSFTDKAKVENLTCIAGKQVSLYAQWSPKKYKITYQLNGGTNNKANPASYKITNATITLKNPTRKGYTFAGWYTSSSYKTKVTKIAKGSTGDRVLYAKWTVNKYIIRYNGNGATSGKMADTKSCQYNKSYTLRKNTFVKKGYTFLGWSGSANGKAKYKDGQVIKNLSSINGKVVNLYAIWQKNE